MWFEVCLFFYLLLWIAIPQFALVREKKPFVPNINLNLLIDSPIIKSLDSLEQICKVIPSSLVND